MKKKYSIMMNLSEGYPFDTRHFQLPNFYCDVSIRIPFKGKSQRENHHRIKKILDLQLLCSSFIRINGIKQDRTQQEFVLNYECIDYGLEDYQQLKVQISRVSIQMNSICQFLLKRRIRPSYRTRDFGFSQEKELKYFLSPEFAEIDDENQCQTQLRQIPIRVNNLLKSIKPASQTTPKEAEDEIRSQRRSERNFNVYNKNFEEKISLIENKLHLKKLTFTDKLANSLKIRKPKKFSQNFSEQNASESNSSSNSFKFIDNKSKVADYKNSKKQFRSCNAMTCTGKRSIKQKAPIKNDPQDEHERSENIPQQQKESKLANSLIIELKSDQINKLKHHKSSFVDCSNYGVQGDKQTKLKKRISFALQKSQNALKVYEIYQSKRQSTYIKR